MARAQLTVETKTIAGLSPTYTAAATDGHMAVNGNGDLELIFKNTNASTRTITFLTPATVAGVAIADPTVVLSALTGEHHVAGFAPSIFNQADGMVYWDYSTTAGVTVAVVKK